MVKRKLVEAPESGVLEQGPAPAPPPPIAMFAGLGTRGQRQSRRPQLVGVDLDQGGGIEVRNSRPRQWMGGPVQALRRLPKLGPHGRSGPARVAAAAAPHGGSVAHNVEAA